MLELLLELLPDDRLEELLLLDELDLDELEVDLEEELLRTELLLELLDDLVEGLFLDDELFLAEEFFLDGGLFSAGGLFLVEELFRVVDLSGVFLSEDDLSLDLERSIVRDFLSVVPLLRPVVDSLSVDRLLLHTLLRVELPVERVPVLPLSIVLDPLSEVGLLISLVLLVPVLELPP